MAEQSALPPTYLDPVGDVGLGEEGSAVAVRLLAAGHPVFGYQNRPPGQAFLHAGGQACSTAAELAGRCPAGLSVLPGARAFRRSGKPISRHGRRHVNWYLAIRRMAEPPQTWRDLIPDHLAWLKARHDEGTIIMSGPSTDSRLGIYIMRVPDTREATEIVNGDPLLRSPGATVEVTEWQLHQIMGIGPFSTGST